MREHLQKQMKLFGKHPCRRSDTHGVTTMELAISLPLFIIVTIFSINTAAFIFAADFCDRACKDCARAAGQMSTPDDAVNAMNAAAAAHPVDNFFFQQLIPELLVYQDYNYSPSTPTPAYGSTSEYESENGTNNLTPKKGSEDSSEIPARKIGLASSGSRAVSAVGRTASALTKNNSGIITNIDTILADPNQTITPGPYVVVHTTMRMRIPISINFFGTKLFAGNVEGNPQLFQLQSTYTFPITNTYVPI
jgi:hypothetical protein